MFVTLLVAGMGVCAYRAGVSIIAYKELRVQQAAEYDAWVSRFKESRYEHNGE
jgi:hypothetical protein